MRIATSTLYDQQTSAIDNTLAQQANLANQLSTGKKLNVPSDDPTQIGQDLSTRLQIGVSTTSAQNVQEASGELTTTESTLSSLGALIQGARQLAITGATDVVSPLQRKDMAAQIDSFVSQAVALANTTYNGKYIFGGTAASSTPPLTTQGIPISGVAFTGNSGMLGQREADGEQLTLSTDLQKAFNFNASNGSLNVFQVLLNLRNTLNGTGPVTLAGSGTTVNGAIVNQSAVSVNTAGKTVSATATLASQANSFGVPLQVGAPITFAIDGVNGSQTFTFNPATDSIDNPPAGGGVSIVASINASVTGVTATWDQKTQKITLASTLPFTVTDITGNFTAAFGIVHQADVVNDLSRQLNDIDTVFSTSVSARAAVGGSLQNLTGLKDRLNTSITNETATQSGIEDASIPDTYAKYAQAQTTLQAAYLTTNKLEAKTLFDYI